MKFKEQPNWVTEYNLLVEKCRCKPRKSLSDLRKLFDKEEEIIKGRTKDLSAFYDPNQKTAIHATPNQIRDFEQ